MNVNILFIYFLTILLYGSVTSQLLDEPEPMIIGGEPATRKGNEAICAMYIDAIVAKYFCAAILIHCKWAISAAHCGVLSASKPENIELRLGSANRKEGSSSRVKTVIIHEKYDESKFDFDICLLELIECVIFTEFIQPSRLPCEDSKVEAFSEVKCTGWGKLNTSDTTIPDGLYEVTINVVPWLVCRLMYLLELTRNMFCVKNFFLGEKGPCQGDSGGYCRSEIKPNDFNCSRGIISFGRGCADPLFATVLTDISKFIGWIKEKTGLCFPDCC